MKCINELKGLYAASHSLAGTLQRMVSFDKTYSGIVNLNEFKIERLIKATKCPTCRIP